MSVESLLNCLDDPAKLVFSERLNHALDLVLWTQNKLNRSNKLAKLCKVDNQVAFSWLNGLSRPDKSTCEGLAEALKIDVDWLTTGLGSPTVGKHPTSGLTSLPQLSLADAGNYVKILQKNTWFRERFAVSTSCSALSFVIYVENEQLSPIFPRDTRFVVDPQQNPNDGDYVLIKSSEQGMQCGTYVIGNEQILFMALNNTKAYPLDEHDQIIGVIVEAITKFV